LVIDGGKLVNEKTMSSTHLDYESLDLFGTPFKPVETYVYFDSRQTFAMRSTVYMDLFYIVNTVGESDDGNTLKAIAVAVHRNWFEAIRSGEVSFRDAFEDVAPFSLFQIDWAFATEGEPTVKIGLLQVADLELGWLPRSGVRLSSTPDDQNLSINKWEVTRQLVLSDSADGYSMSIGGHDMSEFMYDISLGFGVQKPEVVLEEED
jgi:hypothetical protein